MKEEVTRWRKYSISDIKTAKYLFAGKRYKDASFFCQQSVEKALKALLLKRNKKMIKVHDLVRLARELNLNQEFVKDLEKLTFVYVDARYPESGTRYYSRNETLDDIKIAERILKWIKKEL